MIKFSKITISFMLLCTVLTYNIGGVFASENKVSSEEKIASTPEDLGGTDYSVELTEEKNEYKEYKFTHNKTGEVEYLKVESTENGTIYTATSNKGEKAVVTRENDFVTVEEENTEPQYIDVAPDSSADLIKRDYSTMVVPNPGGGKWSHLSGADHYGEHAIDVTYFSMGVGIILSIATGNLPGAAIVGSASTVMSGLVALNVDNFWYIKQTYSDGEPNSFVRAYYTKYYAYPDYTNYTGSLWAE